MAGDWIKMRTQLAVERSTMLICDMTGLDQFAVVGRLHAIWAWAGEHTSNGVVQGVTLKTIDRVTLCDGFGSAMVAADWLEELENGGLKFPRWNKYHSKSARARSLAALRQSKHRNKKKRYERYASVTDNAPREEERERREEKNISDRTDRVKPLGHSDLDVRSKPLPMDLSHIDLSQVEYLSRKVEAVVRPATEEDRRAFLRYVVLTQISFSEDWLMQGLGSINGDPSRKNRAARFVGALQKASGMDKEDFNELARGIDLPSGIWNLEVLGVTK